MNTPLLPIHGGISPDIGGYTDRLAVFLQPIGTLPERMGSEILLHSRSNAIFDYLLGQWGGWRVLFKDAEGRYVGVAQGFSSVDTHVLSNIYVLPWCRRKGVASALIAATQRFKPGLCADSNLTTMGAKLLQYI